MKQYNKKIYSGADYEAKQSKFLTLIWDIAKMKFREDPELINFDSEDEEKMEGLDDLLNWNNPETYSLEEYKTLNKYINEDLIK